ncbi:MAG: radical SAM protein [Coriobacteriia bacterium]|nr:radical SAM protein [Coriobacteriia bacterium]
MAETRYTDLQASGELRRRADEALAGLRACRVCPHECQVDRLAAGRGICRAGAAARVASFGPHIGEERPLVGSRGSGTVFFAHCNLHCVFCQNYDISHLGNGAELNAREIADAFLHIESLGCENLNVVSPTHFTPQILDALDAAAADGLSLPLVWNCGGYESLETLRLLDGVVDIYMPDAKYADADTAQRLSGASDYPERNRDALREMHRQVGELEVDSRGVATRGLLVRHLVLPEGLSGTCEVMRFIAEELSPNTYVNVMAQYRPCFHADEFPEIDRRLTAEEYAEAVRAARSAGLTRLDSM